MELLAIFDCRSSTAMHFPLLAFPYVTAAILPIVSSKIHASHPGLLTFKPIVSSLIFVKHLFMSTSTAAVHASCPQDLRLTDCGQEILQHRSHGKHCLGLSLHIWMSRLLVLGKYWVWRHSPRVQLGILSILSGKRVSAHMDLSC